MPNDYQNEYCELGDTTGVELAVDYAGDGKWGVWNATYGSRIGTFDTPEEAVKFAEDRAEAGIANGVWDAAIVTPSDYCHSRVFNEPL